MSPVPYAIPVTRNVVEYLAIVATWFALLTLQSSATIDSGAMTVLVILACWTKVAFFGSENVRQLKEASRTNLPHHRFLLLMGVNLSQMILAFALDFHLLHRIDPASFAGITVGATLPVALFDFVYLSSLNFLFFGYSDVLPQTVPARLLNLTEIMLAFVTVIVIVSDFMSLKEALRRDASDGERG